jgi:hypothetical protein
MVQNSPRQNITQFGQAEMVQADPEIAIQTGYQILDKTNWDPEEVGGGTVDAQGGGLNRLQVDAAEGSMAALRTVDRGQYVPSFAVLWGLAFIADKMITEDQRFRCGITTVPTWDNSYRLEIEGTPDGEENDYRLQIFKNGNLNIGRHIDTWGSDPRNIGWDETIGCILRSELGWYDFGEWKPRMQIPDLLDDDTNSIIDIVENPDPDVRRVKVPLEQLSPVGESATDNINTRIRFELENIGPNASSNTVLVGNPHFNLLGQNKQDPRFKDVERNGGGIGGGNITTTQPYPLVAIRILPDEDVPMALTSITAVPGTEGHEISAYQMRKEDVTLANGPDADFGPAPGTDTQNSFFEDTDWNQISSVTRWDAAGTGNNDPHRGTEGYPVGRKVAGRTLPGGSGGDKAGQQSGLDANTRLSDLDYLVLFSKATSTDGISLQSLDYEMGVDR